MTPDPGVLATLLVMFGAMAVSQAGYWGRRPGVEAAAGGLALGLFAWWMLVVTDLWVVAEIVGAFLSE